MAKKHGIKHYRLIFVCFVLSIFSWFAVKMSKNYTQVYPFKVEFVNLPKGKVIKYQSDTTIIVEVNSKGIFLLSLDLKKKHLLVDYNFVTNSVQRKSFYTNIQAKQLKNFLIENMNFPHNTNIIEPKNITLELKNEK